LTSASLETATLPRQTDHSGQPNTLPLPELNPLLNPLLSDNMGRWAEVYFRNPPENRERAVLELLQQLETEHSGYRETDVTQAPAQEPAAPQDRTDFRETDFREAQPPVISCAACTHENAGDQRFCGMCGTPLRSVAVENLATGDTATGGEFADSAETANETREPQKEFPDFEDRLQDQSAHRIHAEKDHLSRERNGNSIQLLRSEPPRVYLMYIGAALAVVIVAASYFAWRSGQATAGPRVAVPAAQTTTAQAAAPSPAPATETRKAASPIPPKKIAELGNEVAARTNDGETDDNLINPAALVAKEPVAPTPQPPSAANGSEELAMAQAYLSGTEGHERDDAQAADWLWKAVAKRNAAATLLLSDLYLRGSGVQKNCDQARVLLDAAASRGVRDAAVRLRNMQAFGCE
jgi:hypothetical protein